MMESLWILRHTNRSAQELLDHFLSFLDGNDRLMIIPVHAVDGWGKFNTITDLRIV